MNYRWITALAVVALGVLAGGASYLCFHHTMSMSSGQNHDSLMWVRHEFKLSGEKLAKVEALHEAYESVCAEHCIAIADARKELKRLQNADASPAEIKSAADKAKAIDARCIASTEAHIKEVAALIGGEEGRRYLSIVLPRVVLFDHAGPASLDLHPTPTHDTPAGK
ncbi:MAG: hypothetical protein WC205_07965 [Opitutaceae bacterium]|jgi:hypothetical protein